MAVVWLNQETRPKLGCVLLCSRDAAGGPEQVSVRDVQAAGRDEVQVPSLMKVAGFSEGR
jgi:hypothetical protein